MDARSVNLCVVSQDHSDPDQIERVVTYIARLMENCGVVDSASFKLFRSIEAFHQDITSQILNNVRIEDHRRSDSVFRSIPSLLLDDHRMEPTPRDYLDVLTHVGLFVERFIWVSGVDLAIVLTFRFPSIMMHKYLMGEMEWKQDDIYEIFPLRLYQVEGATKTVKVIYEMPSE